MLLLAVCCGTWAEEVTYTISSKNTLTVTGTAPANSSATIAETYQTSCQMTKGNSQTLTLKGYNGCKISKVTLSMRSNKSSGGGKFSYSTDGGTNYTYVIGSANSGSNFNSSYWHGNWSETYVDVDIKDDQDNLLTFDCGSSDVKIKIEATANSIYCKSYTLTYTNTSSDLEDCNLALANAPVSLNFDLYPNAAPQTISYTTSSTGAVTVSGGEGYVTTSVDATNKTITVTPIAVTPSAQTITVNQAADDDYNAGTATFTVSVTNSDPNVPGTQNNPYTVAQAIEYINTLGTSTSPNEVYVSGIISQVDSYNSNYKSITYWISDDGTTSNQMQVYSGKGLNGADFSSMDDLQVGDIVTVKGKVKKYNSIYEFDYNNELVSLVRKELNYITLSGNYPTTFVEGREFSHEGIVVTAHYNDDSTVDVTERATFSEPNMTQVGEQTVTVSYQNMTATYTITITEAPSHTATFSVNGETYSVASFKEGVAIVFPSDAEAPEGYSIVGWLAEEMSAPQDEAPANIISSAVMGNADVTYYALLAVVTPGTATTTTDVLNRTTTGVTGTSYSDWSGKTVTSDAVYAGNSAGGNESIQLRSKDNSGIVTTTSGGKVKKVTVAWNNNTAADRTLDVYGSNTAYTAASDLYNNDNQGTKLGSIVKGTSTELTVTGDYAFIGLRSNNGAMYLTSISIDWQTGTPDTYSTFCTTIPEPTPSLTINIASACTDGNDNYYGTFYSDKAYIMDDLLEGQVVRVDANGKLVVETAYEGGDIVPANTALLIYAVEPGSYNVYTTTAAGEDWSEYNMLKGTLTADEMTVGENCLFYRLTMHNGEQIGFWWGAENGGAFKPGVNKAYLAVPANQAKDGFAFGNGGDATSISTIDNGQLTMENAYNLQGQKVGSEYKGIVIVNGKKFINK